ncbi:hypothetical protein [Maricaulis sp. CAU 1757]
MLATVLLIVLAALIWLMFRGAKRKRRDATAEAARRVVEAQLERDAAMRQDDDSRA